MELLKTLSLLIVLAPLVGAAGAGLFCRQVSKQFAHRLTIALMGFSLILSLYVACLVIGQDQSYEGVLYLWGQSGKLTLNVGFLIDNLTACMMVTVTFISFLVHIYSIGYMAEDGGYQRFFSYISLFTFFMLMLVTANNFLQLFFGWEGVAAWIKAEIGVGPSMDSGSHTCKGICADLAIAPTNKKNPIKLITDQFVPGITVLASATPGIAANTGI